MFNLNLYIMKKSVQISAHIAFWMFFILILLAQSKLFLEAKPDAYFGQHLGYVMFLEVVMGLVFFYATFLLLPWARKSTVNAFLLGVLLLLLLLCFAFPAMKIGIWQVMSSVVPHLNLILLGWVFSNFR